MSALTEAVAAVVERHHLPFVPHAGQVRCMCGEWTGYGNQHAAHVAAAVESVVAAGRVEDREDWEAAQERITFLVKQARDQAQEIANLKAGRAEDRARLADAVAQRLRLATMTGDWVALNPWETSDHEPWLSWARDTIRAALAPAAAHDPTP